MKRRLPYLVLILVLVMTIPAAAYGSQTGNKVSVTLPEFKVTLNGEEVNNSYSKYPLLVYKGITYFPMTYHDCRFLGLESYWRGNTEGLFIEATDVTVAYQPYRSSVKNKRYQTAVIPGFPIMVNGKAVDNQKEEYPLLAFREITYFPMTWNFGVNEFRWDYSFDGQNGLVIDSDNIKLIQKNLPTNRARNADGTLKNNVAVTNTFVYYEDTMGQIIQAPLADTSRTKAVYQLPALIYGWQDVDGKTFVYASLYAEDGQMFLAYHQGGAIMGTDYLIRLNDDGTTTLLNDTRYNIKNFGDISIKYWAGPAPGPGNLFIQGKDVEWHPLGNQDLLYGWAWRVREDQSRGGGSSKDVYLVGDDLYILGFDIMAEAENTSTTGIYTTGIYKVNINTNETVRISEREVTAFQIEGEHLYYASEGGIYRYSLRDGTEELLKELAKAPNKIGRFSVLNGNVYWQDGLDQNLYNLKGENLNSGAELDGMKLCGDNEEYLVCTFKETPPSKYRLMVFDRKGDVVFKTSDKAYSPYIYITGKMLYFYNTTSETVCIGELDEHPETKPQSLAGHIVIAGDTLYFDQVEIVRREDKERVSELGLKDIDMPSGYIIINENKEETVFELTGEVKYIFTDMDLYFVKESDSDRLYTTTQKAEFLKHLGKLNDFPLSQQTIPYFIEVQNGKVISITEKFGYTI
ncbi:MAG: hypothetical protein ACOYED_08375 [Peptococcia bacterium]|jgi:hypothetical protein